MEEINIPKSIQHKANKKYKIKEIKLNRMKRFTYKVTDDDS